MVGWFGCFGCVLFMAYIFMAGHSAISIEGILD